MVNQEDNTVVDACRSVFETGFKAMVKQKLMEQAESIVEEAANELLNDIKIKIDSHRGFGGELAIAANVEIKKEVSNG
tara:strand:+ start:145 stop:378 length:234 start_codon:yes stop_codon:yes gene_type:complete